MKSILDPSFRHTSSLETDIAKTFAKVRRAQRQAAKAAADATDTSSNVLTLATKTIRTRATG